jgi:hypothetical protein
MITKKAAKRIGTLVNTMTASDIMRKSGAVNKRWGSVRYFRRQWAIAIVALHTEHGIDLPNLENAKLILLNDVD